LAPFYENETFLLGALKRPYFNGFGIG